MQPTPVSLPGKFHGQSSLVGCSPWGHKESGMTEQLTLTYLQLIYNVVLLSSVQQNKSVIHIHISTLFTILFHIDDYRVLREFSVLHSRSLLVIYFIHSSVYMSISISQCIPSSLLPLIAPNF